MPRHRGPGQPTYVLEAGQGNGSDQLRSIADDLARTGLVCTYDRGGFGSSDPAPHTTRLLSELLADLSRGSLTGRYSAPVPAGGPLPGRDDGGPLRARASGRRRRRRLDEPRPAYDDWVRRLRPIVTPQELRENEIGPRSGGVPEEPVDVRESDELLAKPFPQEIPYVVMFAVGSSPSAYLVESANQMSVVHVHADSASLDHHLDLAGPLFPEYADLVTLSSIHIYGEPSEAALGELREKLRILGAGDVIVHDPHVGFVRSVVVSRVVVDVNVRTRARRVGPSPTDGGAR